VVSLHLHLPHSLSLLGIVLGVAFVPLAILGTLFVIVRALLGY
jgi:hypothetical protein